MARLPLKYALIIWCVFRSNKHISSIQISTNNMAHLPFKYALIIRGVPSGEFPLPLLCDHIHFVPLSQPYLFSGDSSLNIVFYSHQKQYLGHKNQKKSVGYVLKYVRKGKNCLKFKAFPRIQSQSVSKTNF